MSDHDLFENFCNRLNSNFKLKSRDTIRSDVLLAHKEQKENLYNYLNSHPCRVTLTIDILTFNHFDFAYICLIAHFIN